MGRFHITVPAVEVTSGRAYTCDITNEDIAYDGVQSGKIMAEMSYVATSRYSVLVVNFSLVSSLMADTPFGTRNNALTIFQCNAADRQVEYH